MKKKLIFTCAIMIFSFCAMEKEEVKKKEDFITLGDEEVWFPEKYQNLCETIVDAKGDASGEYVMRKDEHLSFLTKNNLEWLVNSFFNPLIELNKIQTKRTKDVQDLFYKLSNLFTVEQLCLLLNLHHYLDIKIMSKGINRLEITNPVIVVLKNKLEHGFVLSFFETAKNEILSNGFYLNGSDLKKRFEDLVSRHFFDLIGRFHEQSKEERLKVLEQPLLTEKTDNSEEAEYKTVIVKLLCIEYIHAQEKSFLAKEYPAIDEVFDTLPAEVQEALKKRGKIIEKVIIKPTQSEATQPESLNKNPVRFSDNTFLSRIKTYSLWLFGLGGIAALLWLLDKKLETNLFNTFVVKKLQRQ